MTKWRTTKPPPQFLTICWEDTGEGDAAVTRQARLCLPHRLEIARKYPSARGCGQIGDSCDLCDGREPRTL